MYQHPRFRAPAAPPPAAARAAAALADLRRAAYLSGHARLGDCPPDRGRELAFAGRSNVGKSSLINALCGRRALARAGAAPGRTRLLHFFDLGGGRRLVDLPGYGYARAPRAEREAWRRLVESYLQRRESLARLVLIMDIRHPLRDADRRLLDWCAAAGLPAHLLLNKADKLPRGRRRAAVDGVRRELAAETPLHAVSAREGLGLEEARAALVAYLD